MYKKLQMLIKSVGITQIELAKILNVKPLTIWHRMNGKRDFKLTEAIAIKDYLNKILNANYTVEEIFEKEEN